MKFLKKHSIFIDFVFNLANHPKLMRFYSNSCNSAHVIKENWMFAGFSGRLSFEKQGRGCLFAVKAT